MSDTTRDHGHISMVTYALVAPDTWKCPPPPFWGRQRGPKKPRIYRSCLYVQLRYIVHRGYICINFDFLTPRAKFYASPLLSFLVAPLNVMPRQVPHSCTLVPAPLVGTVMTPVHRGRNRGSGCFPDCKMLRRLVRRAAR